MIQFGRDALILLQLTGENGSIRPDVKPPDLLASLAFDRAFMLRKLYLATAAMILGGYATMTLMGWELTSPGRETIPDYKTVRSSPGGYRSFHFWHTGYHGGK